MNDRVAADAEIGEPHLVEAWKVFNMPPGYNGQEDFFLSGSDLGEYPDSAVANVLACGWPGD